MHDLLDFYYKFRNFIYGCSEIVATGPKKIKNSVQCLFFLFNHSVKLHKLYFSNFKVIMR